MALPDCLLPPVEIRRNLSLSALALRNRRPEMLRVLAKVAMSNWIAGELVRVYHNLTTAQAQRLVDALVEVKLTAVWR
jgi:hypothetical protein